MTARLEIRRLEDGLYRGVREEWFSLADGQRLLATERIFVPEDGVWSSRSTLGYPPIAWPNLARVERSGTSGVRVALRSDSDQTGDHLKRAGWSLSGDGGWEFRLERSYDEGAQWFTTQVVRGTRRGEALQEEEVRRRPTVAAQVRTLLYGIEGSRALAVDPAGGLYFAGRRQSEPDATVGVLRLDPSGEIETVASDVTPAGLAFTRGQLYARLPSDGSIVRLSRDGSREVLTRTPGSSLAADQDGNLYYTSSEEDQVYRLSPDGVVSPFGSAPGLSGVLGMTFDPARRDLYLSTFSTGKIWRIDSRAEVEELDTVPGFGNANVAWIAFANDSLYLTRFGAEDVVRLDLDGALVRVAGSGIPGHRDGRPTMARFQAPNGIAVAPDGKTIYVAELGPQRLGAWRYNRLRAIDLETTVRSPASH